MRETQQQDGISFLKDAGTRQTPKIRAYCYVVHDEYHRRWLDA